MHLSGDDQLQTGTVQDFIRDDELQAGHDGYVICIDCLQAGIGHCVEDDGELLIGYKHDLGEDERWHA